MNHLSKVKGKALLGLLLSCGMLFAILPPASAARATFSIKNYVSGSLETNIKFGSKDCINVPITYKASNSLGWPDHFISLHIRKKLGVENTGGYAAIELGNGKGFLGGDDPYRGKKNVKLCRVAGYTDDEGDRIPVTKPGTYFFQATLTQVRPYLSYDSKTIKLTISN